MKSYIFSSLFLIIPLAACSPSADKAPKIAEESIKVLDKAKAVDATVQQSANEAKQKIDEQSQ